MTFYIDGDQTGPSSSVLIPMAIGTTIPLTPFLARKGE